MILESPNIISILRRLVKPILGYIESINICAYFIEMQPKIDKIGKKPKKNVRLTDAEKSIHFKSLKMAAT